VREKTLHDVGKFHWACGMKQKLTKNKMVVY